MPPTMQQPVQIVQAVQPLCSVRLTRSERRTSMSGEFKHRSEALRLDGFQSRGGRNTAKTLSELVIHDSKNSASSGLRLSSAIAPARQNQFNNS
jgi:hypothetical protein